MQNFSSAAVLNPETLERLGRLDPDGRSKLLERVLTAFETSSERMLLMWDVACESGDASTLQHIAHTLKSSAANIGALSLSETCARLEEGLQNQSVETNTPGFHSSALGVLSQQLYEEWQSVLTAIPRFLADRVRSQT